MTWTIASLSVASCGHALQIMLIKRGCLDLKLACEESSSAVRLLCRTLANQAEFLCSKGKGRGSPLGLEDEVDVVTSGGECLMNMACSAGAANVVRLLLEARVDAGQYARTKLEQARVYGKGIGTAWKVHLFTMRVSQEAVNACACC